MFVSTKISLLFEAVEINLRVALEEKEKAVNLDQIFRSCLNLTST
jgi:hypothetical protein